MYVHAHLRYGEAMAVLGEADALWTALQVVNPIAVTERLAHASPRQRNAYFSSSDAAFRDRYQANAEWERVRTGTVGVDGGWRIYSSGPGLYTNLLLQHAFGIRRHFGKRAVLPSLPRSLGPVRLEMDIDGKAEGWTLRSYLMACCPSEAQRRQPAREQPDSRVFRRPDRRTTRRGEQTTRAAWCGDLCRDIWRVLSV